jgi:hypothetical protein
MSDDLEMSVSEFGACTYKYDHPIEFDVQGVPTRNIMSPISSNARRACAL